MSWKAVGTARAALLTCPTRTGQRLIVGMDATAARVLPLRRRFNATSVSELLGRPGKEDSVAEREGLGPWVSLGKVSGRRVRAKTIAPIAGDREGSNPVSSANESVSAGSRQRWR